jgi:hypothetical protein
MCHRSLVAKNMAEQQFGMVTGRKIWPNGNSGWSLAKNMAERQ